ncbi:MAG: PAS domain S-box protein [Gammaproteobacteria bacterium]
MAANSLVWSKLPKLAAKLAALDQAPVASLWVDADGVIGYVNQRFSETMGYSSNELVGETIKRTVPSLSEDYWRETWWPLLESERYIPLIPLSWQHHKGLAMNYDASVSLVDVAGLSFASFYLWPAPSEQQKPLIFCDEDAGALLQSLGESICLLDESGVINFVNKAFCKLVAGSEKNLIGVPLLELVCPAKSQFSQVWNVLQRKQSETECEFRNLAGKTLHIRMTVVPLNEEGQSKRRYLASFVDITEQIKVARELEAQNDSFERLASNIPGFIYKFRMTPEGEYAFPYASRGCKEIFGVEPASVVNDATPIVQTIHPDDLPMFQSSVLESAIQLSPWNFEARQKTSSGDWKWFHAASRPHLQDNGDIIWEGLVMDVTSQKKVEEELAKAKLAAEASANAKAEFLANMSHEIRTPLNAIIGLNHLVLKSELNPVQRDYLVKIQTSSENLLGIINNILDFSKIESGKLSIEHIEFNLDTVLENIGTMLEPVAAEKKLDLLIDRGQGVPLYMIGDSLRLVQVLTNLCSNAIKFTEHGEVIISVAQEPGDENYEKIRFSVTDTGIGLSERQKSKIFEAFTQADSSTTRHYGGTGLGLTICKHLIELMGGEIGVNSIEGKGSEFYFTLPLINYADTQLSDTFPDELEGWHVLLIMENESACSIFERMLHDLRFKVTVCSLKNMKLETILQQQQNTDQVAHELVLLDWKMSDTHKADIIQAMDTKAFGEQTPVIINISSMEVEDVKQLTESFENIVFLNKPSTPSCLMDAIINASGKDSLIESFKAKLDSSNMAFYEEAVKGLHVLVVEDNEINQEVVCKTLESAEISVDVVSNGKEAINCLLACDPDQLYDAVLMDLHMPVMDGYEATQALRKEKRFDAMPIIAMTAHTIETDKQKCLAAGMQDHIGKPIDLEQMFSKLARWTRSNPGQFNIKPEQTATESIPNEMPLGPSLTSLTTVDARSALRLLQGDEQILLKLLLKFAKEQQSASEQIRQQLDENEWDHAAAIAHQVKGVAGNLHIKRVFELTAQLETALKNRDQTIAAQLLDRLAVEIGRFCQEISQWRLAESDLQLREVASLSKEDVKETLVLLDQLLNYLETNNWRAEDCLEQVKLRMDGLYPQELSFINNHIIDLDFKTAADFVKKLRDCIYSPS